MSDRLTNTAISIVVNLYTGILKGLPNLFHIMTEAKESSYRYETVVSHIDRSGNAVIIAADDTAERLMMVKLQEKHIYFARVPSVHVENEIKANGNFVFILADKDYYRAVEAAQEIKQEYEKAQKTNELEDELEIDQSNVFSAKELLQEDSLAKNVDDDESHNDEDTSPENKKRRKKKKKRSSKDDVQGPPAFYNEKRKDSGHDNRHRAERDSLADSDRFKSANFKSGSVDRITRDEPSGDVNRQNNKPESISDHSHAAKRHDSQEPSLNKSANFKSGGVERSATQEKTSRDNNRQANKPDPVVARVHTAKRHEERESSSNQSVDLKSGNVRRLSEHRQGEQQNTPITVIGNGNHISQRTSDIDQKNVHVSIGKETALRSSIYINIPQQKQFQTPVSAESMSRRMKEISISLQKESDGTRRDDNIAVGKSPQEIRIVRGNIPNYTIHTDKTKAILHTRRLYQLRDTISPKNLHGFLNSSRRIVMHSVVSRDTEAGHIAQDTADFVVPAVQLAYRRFINAGAVEITRKTHCNMDILSAAYAVHHKKSINQAAAELLEIRQLDVNLIRKGEVGVSLASDKSLMSRLNQTYKLSSPAGFMEMIDRMDNQAFAEFLSGANISGELRNKLLSIPKQDLNALNIGEMLKSAVGVNDRELLKMLESKGLLDKFQCHGTIQFLLRGYLVQLLKRAGQQSEGSRALVNMIGTYSHVYGAYRSGVRLVFSVAGKMNVIDINHIAIRTLKDPVKMLGKTIGKTTAKVVAKNTKRVTSRMAANSAGKIVRARSARHATSALKFLAKPLAPLKAAIMNTKLMQALSSALSGVAAKLAPIIAKAGVALGWIAVIIIVIIIVITIFQTTQNSATQNENPMNINFVQNTEIMNEVINELTAKNEAFIGDINNAANHRGSYASTSGITANENVGFYEAGAYNIVFRDAYGNELEPTHVDLNNTKAILSMATKFMPYPFTKLSDSASDEEKKAYEDLKQHFKDYCNFLWASTHQISIEEYHPGNTDGVAGAVDNSGLITSLDRGTCEMDGNTVWLPENFTPNTVGKYICDSCGEVPSTGLGDFADDLCSHGKDKNAHGGWRMSGNKTVHINCPVGHSFHDDASSWKEYCDFNKVYNSSHKHTCYEWIYECGGHMGSVVYVTIGDLSRMPGFKAAADVDYSAVGDYDTGDSITGNEVIESAPEEETSELPN